MNYNHILIVIMDNNISFCRLIILVLNHGFRMLLTFLSPWQFEVWNVTVHSFNWECNRQKKQP